MIIDKQDQSTLVGGTIFDSGRQPIIAKFDQQNDLIWTTSFDRVRDNVFTSVSLLYNKNNRYTAAFLFEITSLSAEKIRIEEVNESGNNIRNQTISASDIRLNNLSISQVPGGDYITLSRIFLPDSFTSDELFMSRSTEDGELLWTNNIAEDRISTSGNMTFQALDNSLLFTSESSLTGSEDNGIVLHKYDLDGNQIWAKKVPISGNIWPLSSILYLNSANEILLLYSSEIEGSDRITVVNIKSLDQEGNVLWEKQYPGNSSDIIKDIIELEDQNYALLSSSSSFGNGGLDVMLSQIDDVGEILWDKTYGSSASDQANKFVQKDNGNFLVLGSTNELSSSGSGFSMFFLATDSEGNPL